MSDAHVSFLRRALEQAQESIAQGGFPAGAVIVKDGVIIGRGVSIGNKLNDPTSHGEMAAIRDACQHILSPDLAGCVLYASMQPCLMCFAASMWGSITEIVFAVRKEKVSSLYYGGDYHLRDINPKLIKPVTFVHVVELEDEALALVEGWEAK